MILMVEPVARYTVIADLNYLYKGDDAQAAVAAFKDFTLDLQEKFPVQVLHEPPHMAKSGRPVVSCIKRMNWGEYRLAAACYGIEWEHLCRIWPEVGKLKGEKDVTYT